MCHRSCPQHTSCSLATCTSRAFALASGPSTDWTRGPANPGKPREIQTPFDRRDTILIDDPAKREAIVNAFGNARRPIWLLRPESYMSRIQVLMFS
jgi:hypothetical protein